jgi:hypothetical protein
MEQEDYKIDFKRMLITAVLWLGTVVAIMFAMASCSAESHLRKADRHIKKAVEKGAVITPDTLYKYIYKTDTLYDVKTNTYTITRTIVDSIPYAVTEKIYVPMSRQERLKYRDSLDHIRELYKLQSKRLKEAQKQKTKQVKQEQKTERKTSPANIIRNILWILVICSIIYVVIKLYPKL